MRNNPLSHGPRLLRRQFILAILLIAISLAGFVCEATTTTLPIVLRIMAATVAVAGLSLLAVWFLALRPGAAGIDTGYATSQALVAHTPDGILLIDKRGRIQFLNPATERLFGYRTNEVSGELITTLLVEPPAHEQRNPLNDSLPVGTILGLAAGARELSGRRKSGETFPVELSFNDMPCGDDMVSIACIRDVSKRKRAQRCLAAHYAATSILANAQSVREAQLGLLQAVCDSLNWEAGALWRLRPEGGDIQCTDSYEIPGTARSPLVATVQELTLPRQTGLLGSVWSKDESVWVDDITRAPNCACAQHLARLGFRSAFACPVMLDTEMWGVLLFASRRIQKRDRQVLDVVTALGGQLGHFVARVHSANLLRQSEERYRALFDANPQPVWVYDCETLGFLAVNEAAVAKYGYSRAEFLAMTVADIRPAEEVAAFRKYLAEGPPELATSGPWKHRCKDETVLDVEIVSHDFLFGTRHARLVLAHDVTERQRAEAARKRLIGILEATPDLVAISHMHGPAQYINPAGRHLLGLADGETVALADCRPEWARRILLEEAIPAALRDGLWRGETAFLAPSGGEIPVSQLIIAHRDREGRVEFLSTIVRDETERKRLEAQLRQAQKMEAVGRLAGGVAHDFNNLLTVINGYSDLVLSDLSSDDPSFELMRQVRRAGDRAASLTGQLLAFSRKQVMKPVPLELNAVIRDMEEMLRRTIGEDIELVTDLQTDIGKVLADPGQIEQVIMNLVVNARDAMPQGGRLVIGTRMGKDDAAVARASENGSPGKHVELLVRDSGCGMSEETLAHAFEPFFTTKEPGKGTGLGLATVYGIVEQSGGHISVESRLGQGTEFRIRLPQLHLDEMWREIVPLTLTACHGGETILLVEDEDCVRSLARRVLESKGYTVIEAQHGPEALALAQDHPGAIDLLLTDVIMPGGIGGRELADRLGRSCRDLKILYVSGYTDDAVLNRIVQEERMPFLPKPFTPASLACKVREVLDGLPVRHFEGLSQSTAMQPT